MVGIAQKVLEEGHRAQHKVTLLLDATYYSVPQSSNPVLVCTTKYYSSTSLYYKVLLQYYSVLQSITPVLLCSTKYYSSKKSFQIHAEKFPKPMGKFSNPTGKFPNTSCPNTAIKFPTRKFPTKRVSESNDEVSQDSFQIQPGKFPNPNGTVSESTRTSFRIQRESFRIQVSESNRKSFRIQR